MCFLIQFFSLSFSFSTGALCKLCRKLELYSYYMQRVLMIFSPSNTALHIYPSKFHEPYRCCIITSIPVFKISDRKILLHYLINEHPLKGKNKLTIGKLHLTRYRRDSVFHGCAFSNCRQGCMKYAVSKFSFYIISSVFC